MLVTSLRSWGKPVLCGHTLGVFHHCLAYYWAHVEYIPMIWRAIGDTRMVICMRLDDELAPGKGRVVQQLIDLKNVCAEAISRYCPNLFQIHPRVLHNMRSLMCTGWGR